MSLVKVSFDELDNCNNNNVWDISPFKFKFNNIIIDSKFYKSISGQQGSWFLDKLKLKFQNIIVEDNVTYDNIENIKNDEDFWYVYNLMLYWYNSSHWFNASDIPMSSINLENEDIDELIKIGQLIIQHGQNIDDTIIMNHISPKLWDDIDNALMYYNRYCFVKTGISSTKHDFNPYPVSTVSETIIQLMSSTKILKMFIEKIQFHSLPINLTLLISKWNDKITKDTEFRVFIEDQVVVGISQQYIYDVWPLTPYLIFDVNETYNKVQNLWDSIYDKLNDKFKYKDAVVDIYIDIDTLMPHLIEINSIGYWGPAGSSLYNWITNPPKLSNTIYFRI